MSLDDLVSLLHHSFTMYSRRHILNSSDVYAHVFFRCHNKQFFLADKDVKLFLLLLWAKYKNKYQINIFDFNIMDNHAHMLIKAKDSECLGHFMRTVNSQLARFINKKFDRDSQAIRERYKSPLITNIRYLKNTMQYIWLNRYKINGQRPETDLFCSASWRINSEVISHLFPNKKQFQLVSNLLDSYDKLPEPINIPEARFVINMINLAISRLNLLTDVIFENNHTIGDDLDVNFRGEWLSAFHREYVPRAPWSVFP
jgi:REP element-mobilizing transposase RayT